MSSEQKFWRLLGDYERLTQNETTALLEFNLPVLREIQDKKPAFFRDLAECGEQCGLDCKNPEVARRFNLLAQAQQRNEAFIAGFLAKRRGEMDSLNRAVGQIRFLRASYFRAGKRREAGDGLFARG